MKKIIAIIVILMAVFMSTAQAEIVATVQSYENVHKYVMKSVPDATEEEVKKCFDAVKNGPEYNIERKKVKITCSEEEMVVFRRLF